MTILLIAGSPAERSRSTALLHYASRRLTDHGFDVSELGLRDLPAEDLVTGQYMGEAAQKLRQRVDAAEAVLIASPIYKASFSGGLKAVLDLLDERALANKLVLPIATGGSAAHLLALEYGFKPVLSSLGARHILAGVYATDKQVLYTGDVAHIDDDVRQRLETSVDLIIDHLKRTTRHSYRGYELGQLALSGQVSL
jgi:FMN reductase